MSCRWWDNEHGGKWGTCTLSDPDNQSDEDETPIRARTLNDLYESIVETRADFSCSLHERVTGHEEWW